MSAQQPEADNDKLAASCFDFLLIELVPLAYRMVADLHAKEEALLQQSRQTHDQHTSLSSTPSMRKSLPDRTSQSQKSEGAASSSADKAVVGSLAGTEMPAGTHDDDEETREAVFWRLEGLGYRVGQGLVER